MAKKTENAVSYVSASIAPIERKIEDFTGIHSTDDVIPVPLGGNPLEVTPDMSSDEVGDQIKEAVPPPAIINNEEKDQIQKRIDNLLCNP